LYPASRRLEEEVEQKPLANLYECSPSGVIRRTSSSADTCEHPSTMRNSSLFKSSLILAVVFAGDEQADAHEMIRPLLDRMMVLEAAMQRVAQLQDEAAKPPAV
jgi:hypothetical protein